MKTFEEIREAILNDVFTNGSDTIRTLADVDCCTAKEYAKQWVDFVCKKSLTCFSEEDGYHIFETIVVEDVKKQIDEQ